MQANADSDALSNSFRHPANRYYPMPFWHINGEMTTAGIEQQLTEARDLSGFAGVAVLPVTSGFQIQRQGKPRHRTPGMKPEYLSDAYFQRYADILRTARQLGMEVVLYDDINLACSGSLNATAEDPGASAWTPGSIPDHQ